MVHLQLLKNGYSLQEMLNIVNHMTPRQFSQLELKLGAPNSYHGTRDNFKNSLEMAIPKTLKKFGC